MILFYKFKIYWPEHEDINRILYTKFCFSYFDHFRYLESLCIINADQLQWFISYKSSWNFYLLKTPDTSNIIASSNVTRNIANNSRSHTFDTRAASLIGVGRGLRKLRKPGGFACGSGRSIPIWLPTRPISKSLNSFPLAAPSSVTFTSPGQIEQ